MNRDDELGVVRLLIDTGILTEEDATHLQNTQNDTILSLMVDRRAIATGDVDGVREALDNMCGSNRTKKLRAHMSIVRIIAGNLQRRMEGAGDRLRTQKERITGLTFPTVAMAKVEGG